MSAASAAGRTAQSCRQAALRAACRTVAPAWPLDQQIAVSPYWGLIDRPFAAAAQRLHRLIGAPLSLSREQYLRLWQDGQINAAHLAKALGERATSLSPADAVAALSSPGATQAGLPLLCDVLDADAGKRGGMSWSARVTQQISEYCATYFDSFQADWHPQRAQGLYAGWREQMQADRSLIRRERTAPLPSEAAAALDWALDQLAVPEAHIPDLLQVIALRIGGWAAWCAYLGWQAAERARDDPHLSDLLIMRLCWEALLHDGLRDACSAGSIWMDRWAAARSEDDPHATEPDLLWQRAHEIAYQQNLFDRLAAIRPSAPTGVDNGSHTQMVFCIDVRSERMRRAIETLDDAVATHGFAGFFGLPIRHAPLGTALLRPQVPGLLVPTLQATDSSADPARDRDLSARRQTALHRSGTDHLFKRLPTGAFTAVEAFGLTYLPRLLLRRLGRPPRPIETLGLSSRQHRELRPRLCLDEPGGIDRQADLVAGIVRAMGLPERFARLLVLVGHTARTTNNPQAAGLACGACGGHSGETNARLLADLLSSAPLRAALAERGICIPRETVIIAALHETVTDTFELFDLQRVPPTHQPDIKRLQDTLSRAGARVRRERAESLGLAHLADHDARLLRQLRRRSNDWAQTRPEWGLADNAALIIAPRERTRGIDLQGRVFLHEYRPNEDPDGTILEQTLAGPMIVAHWINMQYFGSTVDPDRLGSGNKVLHNVLGGHIGVLEGRSGDLRIGLAKQSIHDGSRWRHTPLRLSVLIDAPRAAIERIVEPPGRIRDLLEHEWLYLFRLDGSLVERYHAQRWEVWRCARGTTGNAAAVEDSAARAAPFSASSR